MGTGLEKACENPTFLEVEAPEAAAVASGSTIP